MTTHTSPKTSFAMLTGLLFALAALAACGYQNPNVLPDIRDLPPARIYAPMWSNATSETNLEVQAHGAVSDWLLQAGPIELVAAAKEAQYLLEGRIKAVRYPGFSYDRSTTAQSLNAVMTAAVSLRQRESGRIIWQDNNLRLEETYNLEASVSQTDANQRQALNLLVDSLGEQVYLRVVRGLANLERQ